MMDNSNDRWGGCNCEWCLRARAAAARYLSDVPFGTERYPLTDEQIEMVKGIAQDKVKLLREKRVMAMSAWPWTALDAADRLCSAAEDYLECTEDRQFVHMLRGQECEGECGAALGEAVGAFRAAMREQRTG